MPLLKFIGANAVWGNGLKCFDRFKDSESPRGWGEN